MNLIAYNLIRIPKLIAAYGGQSGNDTKEPRAMASRTFVPSRSSPPEPQGLDISGFFEQTVQGNAKAWPSLSSMKSSDGVEMLKKTHMKSEDTFSLAVYPLSAELRAGRSWSH